MKVVEFSTFCPVALAGIGSLPVTIRSRAIVIPMRRRAPDETVRPYRERVTRPEGEALGARLAAWVERHGDTIPEEPELPAGVTDRQADVWEPLLAIADAAGGHWPAKARAACAAMVAEARGVDEASLGVRLLADIRDVFGGRDRLDTGTLIDGLCDIDTAPWGDWLDGKGARARGSWLAKKLKPFDVGPGKHRFGEKALQGYLADDFAEVWRRYLPPLTVSDDGSPLERNTRNKRNTPASDVPSVPSRSLRDRGLPKVHSP
ncbi:MAG: DUF3631 domain-containing protein [Acidimicrobiales bacterium]